LRIRDVGEVTIGNAPRLGEFGFQKNDDSVEGVILMFARRANTKTCSRASRKKTEELNNSILPSDVKVRPFYDRSDLVAAHDRHGRAQHARGNDPCSDRADLFPGQFSRGRHCP